MKKIIITQSINSKKDASFDRYSSDIRKEALISAKEEIELAKRIRDGDLIALDKMVRANLRFVISVAKKYQNQGLALTDLINEGNLGLIMAAKRFDETRGFKFISYAVFWIRHSIIRSICEKANTVKLPSRMFHEIGRIKKAFSKLEQKHQREPNIDEMAELLEQPESKISELMSISAFQVSIDAPLAKDDDSCLADVLENPNTPKTDNLMMSESMNYDINRLLNMLTDQERVIVQLFYGIGVKNGLSLEKIGVEQGLTRERIRQIKKQAIGKLKQSSMIKLLQTYLA